MTSNSTHPQEPTASFSLEDFDKALGNYDYNFQKGQVVRGKVSAYGSEGAYIDIGGKSPGFVPLREAALEQVTHTNLAEVLPENEEIEFLIIREQNADGQVLLSCRQLAIKQAWEELAEMQTEGKSVQMRVSGTNRGGVTGEVNGIRAFIPRSHLMEQDNLDSLVGQPLTATFLEVNQENNKLVLSQREAARAAAIGKLEKGALMEGKVVNIKPYGAFIDLNGVTGLLHVKEVSSKRLDSLDMLFEIGQTIQVMIVEIDEWNNRISLSTKILEEHPGEMLDNMNLVMSTAEERAEKAREKLAES
ncbi:MAG: S1 RNA-binding domain-containing protein [Oscillatoria sp. PMC 1051.18]|nr:S1 RNA-binding domain-containing protein [Oscillatoria sp. PMC 1050.18]MEC5032832.1 S1 RNA-binding domain-containing protein [Oscillatoria sp. PMC 1051.18]